MQFSGRWRGIAFAGGALCVAFFLLGIAGIATWEYTNSDAFCARACHSVHPEETYAHRASQHAQVECVECHMGRLSTFEMMAVKVTHTSELWGMLTGYDRPLTSHLPASRDSCEACHSEEPHQNDSVRVRKHYAPDEANTETKILLILRTAGGAARDDGGKGIHWHTENLVRFITTDAQKLNIPWVEVTKPDGHTVTYRDVTQSLTESEVAAAEKRVMDCTDCHNRVGHPFRDPEQVIDGALAEGRLNRRFPYIKARLVDVLQKDFSAEEDALGLVKAAWEQYLRDFPNVPTDYPDDFAEAQRFIRERQKFVANLMSRSRFLEPEVSWRSFLDHGGHENSPGCFRCHSGKHVSAEGTPIPVNCTLCHAIPVVFRKGESPLNLLPPFDLPTLDGHRAPNFMREHRVLFMEESCQTCHGEISFGAGNDSFCSNSACHGREWPHMTLDAG
jgi:hypothetical protein